MSNAQPLTQAQFRNLVIDSDKPVLIDFWAEWCGPCRKIAPIIDEVAETMGDKAAIYKVNVDEERGLAAMFGIQSIPTLKIFNGGKEVDSVVGGLPKVALVEKLQQYT
ncbi:MAG: thioredoxin [Corynebacterium sp.]|nr:thioredoxin [Corynebacterium sp.]